MPIIVGSRDIGQAHFWGKFFVRPCTKFEVSSLSSFEDIFDCIMPKIVVT